MPHLTIHDLDESLATNLRIHAQQHGQTIEEEARQILHLAFSKPSQTTGDMEPPQPVHLLSRQLLDAFQTTKNIPARGAMKGMLSSVDEFIANKAAEIALEENG